MRASFLMAKSNIVQEDMIGNRNEITRSSALTDTEEKSGFEE